MRCSSEIYRHTDCHPLANPFLFPHYCFAALIDGKATSISKGRILEFGITDVTDDYRLGVFVQSDAHVVGATLGTGLWDILSTTVWADEREVGPAGA